MSEPRYGLHDFNTIPADDPSTNGHVRDSWLPLNLADLPSKPPTLPTLGAIDGIGLLYPGKRHIFSGPQESAKTLAAYILAIQTIRDGGTVILLDFEMGAYDARARLTDLGATDSDLSRLLYAEPDDPATEDRIALLIGLSPDLVVVDAAAGAYSVQGLDDNKRADVETLTNLYIRSFWKHGIATIMLDHVVKSQENRGAYAIGSERKVGGADVHLGFSVITPISRGHSGLYKITTHKDRGGYLKRGTLAEMELQSHPETHEITCQLRPAEDHEPGKEFFYTKRMQDLSQLLDKQLEPPTKNQLIDLQTGERQISLKAIDALIRLGYVSSTPGPRRSQLLTNLRPFTVLEWENQPDQALVRTGSPLVREPLPLPLVRDPLKGARHEPVGAPENQTTGSAADNWSWVDELTPRENGDPPADLHHQETP
jgi:hypothetical protein